MTLVGRKLPWSIIPGRIALGVVWACALSLTASPALAQYSDGKIKIGVLTDMSGIFADNTGKGSVEAARMAIDEFGGKVNGVPIELVIGDHQNKPDVGATIASRWFDEQQVDVVADLVNSAVALSVQEIAKRKGKVTLISGGATVDLTGKACSPTGVHWTYDTWSVASGIGEAAPELGKKWFFITADYAFGHALEAGVTNFIKRSGAEVVGSVRHPFNTRDFASFLLQAQGSAADVIALANAGEDMNNAIKQGNEFGIARSGKKVAGLMLDVANIRALGLPVAQGSIYVTPFHADLNDATRTFAKRFQERDGRAPGYIPAGVYSAVRHYLKAIEDAKTDEANRVVETMRKLPISDGFTDKGVLREDGRMVHDMYLVQVKTPAESKSPGDYLKLIRTLPGERIFRPMSEGGCPHLR